MTNECCVNFEMTGNPAHRTVAAWRHEGPTPFWDANALKYAKTHGEALVLLANGKVKRFLRDEDISRQVRWRTYTKVYYVRE